MTVHAPAGNTDASNRRDAERQQQAVQPAPCTGLHRQRTITSSALRTPGMRQTVRSDMRWPVAAAGSAGNAQRAYASSPTPSRLINANAQLQPICWPNNVPAGPPRDTARGEPTLATAIAAART
ncbi:hypothetical protein G6F32_014261 [Rhizopus arrhizus]|nr:hypothetical protein G6F32_014261 [Rhizopus arrhizus]